MVDAIVVLLAILVALFIVSPWLLAAVVALVGGVCIWAVCADRKSKQQHGGVVDWCREEARKSAIEKQLAAPVWYSPVAERLAREKLPLWEYYLTEELLAHQLRPLRQGFDQLRSQVLQPRPGC